MTIVHAPTGTNVHEIAAGVFRISVPVPPEAIPGGFTFNQFLVVDDAPLLFHTGMRRVFPAVKAAVEHVLGSAEKLRYVGFSHFEADECGALNEWLGVAPQAEVLCSQIAAMVSLSDFSIRPGRPLADGEEVSLGKKRVRWLDAPHLPHNWECGYLYETTDRTLFCGDVFTHGGDRLAPITESDVIGPAEESRKETPAGFAVEKNTSALLEKLARTEPTTLALMHGSSYRGDGRRVLQDYAELFR